MPLTQRSRGGEIPKTLKISEVAEKINSIQVGGGMVDLTKSEHMSLENNGSYSVYDVGEGYQLTINFTLKFSGISKESYLCVFLVIVLQLLNVVKKV